MVTFLNILEVFIIMNIWVHHQIILHSQEYYAIRQSILVNVKVCISRENDYHQIFIISGVIFFPKEHTCKPRELTILLKEGNVKQARSNKKFIWNFINFIFWFFEEKQLIRFGNWNQTSETNESNVLTLVLSKFDGFYSIILNL